MSMKKVFILEARKLTQVATEYDGMIDPEDMGKVQEIMKNLDQNFIVTPQDLVESFENFMAAWATALHVAKLKKSK